MTTGFTRVPESPVIGNASGPPMFGGIPAEASLLFSPFSHLPPVVRGAEGMMPGNDGTDMFGSYFPAWDADLLFGGMTV